MQFLQNPILHRVITSVQMSLEGMGQTVCICVSGFTASFSLLDPLFFFTPPVHLTLAFLFFI